MSFHLRPSNSPTRRPVNTARNTIVRVGILQDAKQCRNLLDGEHNGHPGPLGALTHHAYGIHTEPFPPDSVIEHGTHDVSSFGLASIRILERPKTLLDSDCLNLGDAIASPNRRISTTNADLTQQGPSQRKPIRFPKRHHP